MKDIQTFMVDLDSILDTRMGLLLTQSPELADKNMTLDYFKRKADHFIDMPFQVFRSLYEKRDITILRNSLCTPFVNMLLDFVLATYKNSINGYEQKRPRILINTYPYKLEEDDIESLKQTFITLTKGMSMVEFVDMRIEEITPIYLRDNIEAFSIYEYPLWLETHAANENLKNVTIPDIGLFGPQLHFKQLTSEENNFILQSKLDPFEQIEKMAAPFVHLKTVHIAIYSADLLPKEPPQPNQT